LIDEKEGLSKEAPFFVPKSAFYAYFCTMDHDIELRFQKLQKHLEKDFGPGMDMSTFLFLVGVNELGMGHQTFSKQQKMELMHIAICTLLEPYGYYTFNGRDADLWPHFILNQQLPPLNHQQQQHLLKEALLDYFIKNEYYHEIPESI
jgi:hypothetical protein